MRYDFIIAGLYYSIASFLVFAALFIFTRKAILYGIKLVGVLAFANVLFLFGQASVILSDSEEYMLIFSHIQLLGYAFIPTLWYLVSYQQKKQSRRFSLRMMTVLLHIPLVAIIALYVYPWTSAPQDVHWFQQLFFVSHHLSENFSIGPGFVSIIFQKGVIFYIFAIYNILITALAIINYIYTYKNSLMSNKKNALLLIFTTTISLLFPLSSLFSANTIIIDFTPVATSTFVLISFFALYKYELFDLTPLAYRQVFEEASFPVFILDKSECLISMNHCARELYKDKITFNTQFKLSDFDVWDANFSPSLKEYSNYEFKINTKNQTIYFLAKLEELHKNARFMGYLLTYRDITTHKLEMKRMEHMATYDDLTKIYNRRFFYLKALEGFDDAVIHKQSVSFIMFDLDDFKDVNDIYGHQAGDYVLAEMADICSKIIPSNTIFARYGGEEFVLFLKNTTPDDAVQVADTLRSTLEKQAFKYGNHKIYVTASFGISGTDKSINKSFEQYLKEADEALYEVKNHGKNKVSVKY